MQNNYFSYDGQVYHQIRGGAMGSPLTLTIANCYMYFFERNIVKQVRNSGGLYMRYIDDIFIIINWPHRHLFKQIDKWNKIDLNIKLNGQIGPSINFLDLHMENIDGHLQTKVYHKPSYEPYYLPFNSIHPLHMKKNIPYTMLLRAIRYCSSFQLYIDERESLRMALLLNKYPGNLINKQFEQLLIKYHIKQNMNIQNYGIIREQIINSPLKDKTPIDYENNIFIHFTYCSSMKKFPILFHNLWQKYFKDSPIADTTPILGTRNANNLQRQLVHTKNPLIK
jgi:hypothetical protein